MDAPFADRYGKYITETPCVQLQSCPFWPPGLRPVFLRKLLLLNGRFSSLDRGIELLQLFFGFSYLANFSFSTTFSVSSASMRFSDWWNIVLIVSSSVLSVKTSCWSVSIDSCFANYWNIVLTTVVFWSWTVNLSQECFMPNCPPGNPPFKQVSPADEQVITASK